MTDATHDFADLHDVAAVARTRDAALRRRLVEDLGAALIACAEAGATREAAQLCAIFVEDVAAGWPDAGILDHHRADAELWADAATAPEVEAVTMAGLRRIERDAFAERARKRLIRDLWQTMPAEWRRAFLSKVDPAGTLRGAS